jgi:hypothetical protein
MHLVAQAGVFPAGSITVCPNSIRFMKMDGLLDAGWQDEFTWEEMLEQQSRLLTEECHMLQKELSRYRKNMAKLIDMHNDAAAERDKRRIELKRTAARLSSTLVENTALGNRNRGLETCREQLEAIYKTRRERSAISPSTAQD